MNVRTVLFLGAALFGSVLDEHKGEKMKKIIVGWIVAAGVASVFAGLECQGPDATHAWAIHDRNRPNPVKIDAPAGKPPSDAIVLFDGTKESVEKNWCTGGGEPCKWEVVDGEFRCVPKSGSARTKRSFADCQLHLEWKAPTPAKGLGQGRGNSGVFLFGLYEIQVLDSYLTDPSKSPNPNPNYADGQAAAVYAQNPPMVNPARPEGEWQTYDIIFHAPVWEGEKLVKGPTVTVLFNGVLVQDNWEFEGSTYNLERKPVPKGEKAYPISLQDHGNPVPYRNIWIREIPSVYANTTHGGPGVKAADVLALREKTAAALFAKLGPKAGDSGVLNAALEILTYSKKSEYVALYRRCADDYVAKVSTWDDAAILKNETGIRSLDRACGVLVKYGVLESDDPLVGCVKKLAAKLPAKQ